MLRLSPAGSFAVCADPAGQAEAVAQLDALARDARDATRAFRPLGLILTGSLARGEGSLECGPDGAVRWLSDIECIAVFPDATGDFRALNATLRGLESSFNAEPGRARRGVRMEVRAITAAKLARMREVIFSRELFADGKLLWGDPDAIAPPPWTRRPPRIPAVDALRLLSNRVVERLGVRLACEAGACERAALAYRNAKFWLDLGTSLSVFLGCYRPGYRARHAALAERLGRAPRVLDAGAAELLLGRLGEAMEFKLRGGAAAGASPALAGFNDGAEAAAWALRWETDRMLADRAPRGNGWTSIPMRLRRVESAGQRLRDWGRFGLCTGRGNLFGARWPRVMVEYGSPTAAIYAAACLLDFHWDAFGSGRPPAGAIARALGRLFGVDAAPSPAARTALARATLRAWTAHVRFAAA